MKKPKFEHNTGIVTDYETFLKLRSLKERTIENRLFGAYAFLLYIGEKDARTINRSDVNNFAVSLKESDKAESTVSNYLTSTKLFLNWLSPNNDFFKDIKIKDVKTNHNGDEIINIEGVKQLLAACKSQRDRALIFLMWDTAGRLGEILNLNIKDLKIEKQGIQVHLNGKTGPREVYLLDAVPDVKAWLNLRGGELNDPLFPTPKGTRLTHSGAQKLLKQLAKRAGLTEFPIHPHILRHGRLTSLSNAGMPEMHLRLFAGWSNDSDMPSVYINPTKKDVKNKLLKIHNREPEEEPVHIESTAPKKCPSCKMENPFDATYCSFCSTVLDPKVAAKMTVEATKKERELQDLKDTITRMSVIMEKMEKEAVERQALEDEFREVLEEERAQVRAVEEVTGMDFEDAMERYDVGQIMPPDSENLKAHHRRLKTDQAYKERWKQRVSNKAKNKYEKTVKEDTMMIISSAKKLTGTPLNDLI